MTDKYCPIIKQYLHDFSPEGCGSCAIHVEIEENGQTFVCCPVNVIARSLHKLANKPTFHIKAV